ncbi:MAG: sterol desaturase family protein [Verrucomicrobiota bacterium]
MIHSLFEWSFQQSTVSWCRISLAGNSAAALLSILGCWLIARLFRRHPIFEAPQPVTVSDLLYCAGSIGLNSVVAIIGWLLWKSGWIIVHHGSFLQGLADTLLLIFIMDFAMYCLHRVAHHPLLYRVIHGTHHVHESTNPVSLFVLNPFEVLGFGSLLIAVLMLLSFSEGAILLYLSFNMICGTIGHLGVEPLPIRLMRFPLLRYLGTSTFHGLHHADRGFNFGFYTTLWDRLFHTLHPGYDARFLSRSPKR